MKRDLIVFVSEAGAGKDYLLNRCVTEFGWSKVVSHTTRLIRPNEKDGVDYHFISDSEFFKIEQNREFIETTSYTTTDNIWHYGFHKDSIEGDGIKCLILNPHGLDIFIEKGYADRILIVSVLANAETRIKRYYNRLGDNPTEHQLAEGFLRLLRDINDFDKFFKEIVFNIGDACHLYKDVPVVGVENDEDDDISFNLGLIKSFVEVFNAN